MAPSISQENEFYIMIFNLPQSYTILLKIRTSVPETLIAILASLPFNG